MIVYMIRLGCVDFILFSKQKTAYEMRIRDWSSDVCSSDLDDRFGLLECQMVELRPDVGALRAHFRRIGELREAGGFDPCAFDEIGRASCRERVCQYV